MSSQVVARAAVEVVETEKEGLALYSLSDPESEVVRRAEVLELRRREAIARLADRWVGKPSNPGERTALCSGCGGRTAGGSPE